MQVSLIDNKLIGPTLLATIPFSAFIASGTYWTNLNTCLQRNARQRTYHFINTMDQGISSISATPFDSTTAVGSTFSNSVTLNTPGANGNSYVAGSQYSQLLENVDSIRLGLGMGATAPTTGNLKIYVTEVM